MWLAGVLSWHWMFRCWWLPCLGPGSEGGGDWRPPRRPGLGKPKNKNQAVLTKGRMHWEAAQVLGLLPLLVTRASHAASLGLLETPESAVCTLSEFGIYSLLWISSSPPSRLPLGTGSCFLSLHRTLLSCHTSTSMRITENDLPLLFDHLCAHWASTKTEHSSGRRASGIFWVDHLPMQPKKVPNELERWLRR